MYDEATLWKLIDGDLPDAEAEAIEAAAKGDAGLRRRLEQLRTLKRGVLEGAPEPSPDFAARVAAKAVTLGPAPIVDLDEARRLLKRALIAAAILAALGLAYLGVEIVPEIIEPLRAEPEPLFGGR